MSNRITVMCLQTLSRIKNVSKKHLYNVRMMSTETSTKSQETTQPPITPLSSDEMLAWQIKSFGNLDDSLELASVKKPIIKKPTDVLVQVEAASVNPLDVAMIGGYGNVLLNAVRQIDDNVNDKMSSPIILGRDFAGKVIAKGNKVRSDIMIGDKVYGVVPPHLQGCHAHQVITDETMICRKPDGMDPVDAAGILYAGITAWSALQITGDLLLTSAKNKKVLVVGASGGVGTMAVQLLKAWKAEVIATCRTDAVPMVESLSADRVIDYTVKDALKEIERAGKYDVILDASGAVNPSSYVPLLKEWCNAKFITLRPPMLKNTDEYGLMMGMARNFADILMLNVQSGAPTRGCTVRWGFFMPIPPSIKEVSQLVEDKKLKVITHKVFDFNKLPEAYDTMTKGHVRGKIIIKMDTSDK